MYVLILIFFIAADSGISTVKVDKYPDAKTCIESGKISLQQIPDGTWPEAQYICVPMGVGKF